MDYRILGPLEIRAGDRLVLLRGVRQRELMAVLLLRANEIVSSDRLIDELWEGDPPPTAAKMIQNGVSQLRKLIEPDARHQEPRLPAGRRARRAGRGQVPADGR